LAHQTVDGVPEEIYAEFQGMCVSLTKKHSSLARDETLQPNPTVRALWLPLGLGPKHRADAAWSASRRMSLALSGFVSVAEGHGLAAQLSALASELDALPQTPRSSARECPESWELI